ncbi:MAG: phosphatase PAP2 family protein [Candidatus Zixiibacteriota bacterium]
MRRAANTQRIYPYDWLIIGYSVSMLILITLFGRPLQEYADELLFYSGTAVLAAVLARYLTEDSGSAQRFIRLLYPMLLFTLFYRMTGGTMFLVFDRFFDSQLTGLEQRILGVEPSLSFDHYLPNTLVTELLSFSYFSYYFMIPVFFLVTFFSRRYDVIKRSMTAICMMFFVSYLLFVLYPIEGPRWHFAELYTNSITGPFFRPLVDLVIANGAVRGGCMPSSHVGVALVVLVYSLRQDRRIGWFLVPINLGLAAGTVWGRFHYVSDVVVGAAIGIISVLLVDRYYPRFAPANTEQQTSREVVYHNAS